MKLADGVAALEIKTHAMGREMVIHPTLLWDDENVILVDTGIPGMLPQIRAEMERAGVPFEKLTKVILTHQDIDHLGGLPEILAVSKHEIEVLAHAEDAPYIEGKKPLIKMNPERMAQMVASLPEEQRRQIEAMFAHVPSAKVNQTIADGEVLPYCGGITVVFTPGHTPGHISLYLQNSHILIAGDAMVVVEGQLQGPVPHNTPDMETATKSLKKYPSYDIEQVLCYHGGLVSDNIQARLHELTR